MDERTTRTSARACALGAAAAIALSAAAAMPASAAPEQVVTVHVDATNPGRQIPSDFLGLSFEANQLHHAWTSPDNSNVATLLENLGAGNMRFSANQVDLTAWMEDPTAAPPEWADGQIITPDDLSRLGELATASGWSVDLGVNLKHYDPEAAASEVVAAQERIGDSLRAVSIGNEPNLYVSGDEGHQPYNDPSGYVIDARAYRDAIEAAAPGMPIEGPDTAGISFGSGVVDPMLMQMVTPWLDSYIDAFGDESSTLTQHYYPYVNSKRMGVSTGSSDVLGGLLPDVDDLLSADTDARQTAFIRDFVTTADEAGLAPILSETNSVANEGRPGVTNSFGGALWTVEYLMTAAREGIAGINLHTQVDDCGSYSLICFADQAAEDAGSAQVNPNYYAGLMVAQMVGGDVLSVSVDANGAHVTAYAVRTADGSVKVIVDNLDRDFDGTVRVDVEGADGTATVQRLTAPSPDALDGTTFAGAAVSADGSFAPGSGTEAPAADGLYTIDAVDPSAVLLTIDE